MEEIKINTELSTKLENLPTTPGVYQFKDDKGKILYVGKAKVLRNRVRQYFQSRPQSGRLMTMISKIRRDKKKADFDEVDFNNHSHSDQYSDLKVILREAINKLPEIQRTVILLRDYEGYDYKEIGEITDLSESQVKVYIYRGRQALKEYLGSVKNLI